MAKKTAFERNIEKTLKAFPKHIAEKKKRALARKKFLKETFGDMVKEIRKMKLDQ